MLPHPAPRTGRSLLPYEVRRLIRPLSISLVVHALVFSPVPGVLPSPDNPAARRSDLHANLHRAASATTAIEEPRIIPTAPTRTAPKSQPETRAYSRPANRTKRESLPEKPIEPERVAAQSDQSIEPIRNGIDAAGLRQYHLALGQNARQFRRYPEEARDAGWKGRVAMRIAVSEMGLPLGISLLGSSGFGILDKAALDMMFLAASHTEVPESLRGRAFTIDLAVDYNPGDAP